MLDAAEALGFIGASPVAHLVNNLPANAGDARDVLDPWVGKYLRGGTGNPLQCSSLENPMDREPGKLQFVELQRVGHD